MNAGMAHSNQPRPGPISIELIFPDRFEFSVVPVHLIFEWQKAVCERADPKVIFIYCWERNFWVPLKVLVQWRCATGICSYNSKINVEWCPILKLIDLHNVSKARIAELACSFWSHERRCKIMWKDRANQHLFVTTGRRANTQSQHAGQVFACLQMALCLCNSEGQKSQEGKSGASDHQIKQPPKVYNDLPVAPIVDWTADSLNLSLSYQLIKQEIFVTGVWLWCWVYPTSLHDLFPIPIWSVTHWDVLCGGSRHGFPQIHFLLILALAYICRDIRDQTMHVGNKQQNCSNWNSWLPKCGGNLWLWWFQCPWRHGLWRANQALFWQRIWYILKGFLFAVYTYHLYFRIPMWRKYLNIDENKYRLFDQFVNKVCTTSRQNNNLTGRHLVNDAPVQMRWNT